MAPSNEIHVYSYSKIKETTPLNQNVGQQINKNYGKNGNICVIHNSSPAIGACRTSEK
jgi:hypothetical protein